MLLAISGLFLLNLIDKEGDKKEESGETLEFTLSDVPGVLSDFRLSSIFIPNPKVNIGQVSFEGEARAEFTLINSGAFPLIIDDVEKGCDCTVAQWEKKPIPPGDSTTLQIQYEDTHIPGKFFRVITVKANIPEESVALTFEGEVLKN